MTTLYECTIFVSLTLLAILIAIFVFAVSIYRAASELSDKTEKESLNERKELISRKREELVEKIRGISDESLARELRAESDKLQSELAAIDMSILKASNRAQALSVRNMVVFPALIFLASIITSGIAIPSAGLVSIAMGIVSWALIIVGLYFLYLNLRTVEFFSNYIDLSTLMERALERHAESRRPIIDLDISDYRLIIKHGDIQEISPVVFVKQGLTAKNIKIRFVATGQLNFPGEKLKKWDYKKKDMKGPRLFFCEIGDLNYGVYSECRIKVKAPEEPGEYAMSYWITCDEYTGKETFFKIRVI
jgi:biopolymer transport protein ExbB/TolQ